MTSSYFQRCSDGFSNTEVAPDIGYHFIHLWCSVTGKTKALARKSVGSPSKETLTPAPSILYSLLHEPRHSGTNFLLDGFTFKQCCSKQICTGIVKR